MAYLGNQPTFYSVYTPDPIGAPLRPPYSSIGYPGPPPLEDFLSDGVRTRPPGWPPMDQMDSFIRRDVNPKRYNRKFDLDIAVDNFVRGVFSPVTSLYELGRGLLGLKGSRGFAYSALTVGAIAAGTIYAPTLLATAGVAYTAFQGIKAVYQGIKAFARADGDELERAFGSVGYAASGVIANKGVKKLLGDRLPTPSRTRPEPFGQRFKRWIGLSDPYPNAYMNNSSTNPPTRPGGSAP